MSVRVPRVRLLVAAGLAVSAVVVFLLPPSSARAQTAAVIGTATATGARGTYTVPNFLILSTIFDGGGPISQAVFNTSGDATGFGSLPYPGDTVVNAPGLLSVATGQPIPFSYPFFVQATRPTTPEADASDPSGQWALKATATDAAATGLASIGTGASPSGATSTSSIKTDDAGKVLAVGESTVRGINLGGVLKIASVTSRSETSVGSDGGKPVSKASTAVEGASVAGQPVVIGPNGIGLPGQSIATQPVADALNAVLKQAGITVKTVASTPIEGGLSTSGLQVTQTAPLPIPGAPVGTMVFEIASTSSSIVSGTAATPTPAPGAPADVSGTGQGVPLSSGTGAAASTPADVGAGSSTASPAAAVPATGAGRAASPEASLDSGQLLARDLRSTFRILYVVGAVAAALVLAGSAVWRSRAVSVSWIPDR